MEDGMGVMVMSVLLAVLLGVEMVDSLLLLVVGMRGGVSLLPDDADLDEVLALLLEGVTSGVRLDGT
jgi:hypothetical protein